MSQPSTWYVHVTGDDTDTVTAQKDAEAGKTHYITGFIASCDMGDIAPPESAKVTIRDGAVFGGANIATFYFTSTSQKIDTSGDHDVIGPTGAPLIHSFTHPIRCVEGNLCYVRVDPQGSSTPSDAVEISATLFGFTTTERTDPA